MSTRAQLGGNSSSKPHALPLFHAKITDPETIKSPPSRCCKVIFSLKKDAASRITRTTLSDPLITTAASGLRKCVLDESGRLAEEPAGVMIDDLFDVFRRVLAAFHFQRALRDGERI